MTELVQNILRNIFCGIFILLTVSCSPSKRIEKSIKKISASSNYHTGFVLYDPAEKKTLISFNGSKYFTPASNTKIITLFTGLKLLGDSVPALRYQIRNDSLIFTGTGDPSFLNENTISNPRVFTFLKSFPGKLFLNDAPGTPAHYGSGWAWDDYDAYYQAERTAFPIYGNSTIISGDSTHLTIQPRFFKDSIYFTENSTDFNRLINANFFQIQKTQEKLKKNIPFRTSNLLTRQLLSDTLHREIYSLHSNDLKLKNKLYSVPADSIYKTMMQVSDNFIAEQILLMASQQLRDTMHTEFTIDHMQKNCLNDLPQPLFWVDGSGLSRYNQFTPESIVKVWEKILEIRSAEKLFPLLAKSGNTGSITGVFKDRPGIIHGKTGSLRHQYSLSGFILTKSGKTYIFSSMNANFAVPTNSVRSDVERILNQIYETF